MPRSVLVAFAIAAYGCSGSSPMPPDEVDADGDADADADAGTEGDAVGHADAHDDAPADAVGDADAGAKPDGSIDAAADSHPSLDAMDAMDATDATDATDAMAESDASDAPSLLTVVSVDPADAALDVAPDHAMVIEFSRPIVLPTKRTQLDVVASAIALPNVGVLSPDGRKLTISGAGWPLLATIVTTLTTEIVAVDGGHLDHDYTFRFDTKDGTWRTPFVATAGAAFLDVALTGDNRYGLVTNLGTTLEQPDHTTSFVKIGTSDIESSIVADAAGQFAFGYASGGVVGSNYYRAPTTVTTLYSPTGTLPPKLATDWTKDVAPIWAAWPTTTGIQIGAAVGRVTFAGVPLSTTGTAIETFGLAVGGDYVGVAWTETVAGGIFGQRLKPDVASAPTKLAIDPATPRLDTGDVSWPTPKVAMSGDGALFVAWIVGTSAKVARFDGTWSTNIVDAKVPAHGGASESVTVAASISGDAIVAWDSTDRGLAVERYDAIAKAWQPVLYLATTGAPGYAHSSAMDPVGNALVAWTDAVGVWVARYDHRADKWSTPSLLAAGGSEARVALGLRGGLCAWEHPSVTLALLE